MKIIKNSITPKNNCLLPVASFSLQLFREGDKLILHTPQPRCYRDFHSFTGAEKDAYNYIVRLIIEQGSEAMRRAESEAAERARK